MKFRKSLFDADRLFDSRLVICEKDGELFKVHHCDKTNRGAIRFCKKVGAKPLYAFRVILKFPDARLAA
jgi:hypothetical protein